MRGKQKMTALLLSLCMLLAVCGAALAEPEEAGTTDGGREYTEHFSFDVPEGWIHYVFGEDQHGYFAKEAMSYAGGSAAVYEFEAPGPESGMADARELLYRVADEYVSFPDTGEEDGILPGEYVDINGMDGLRIGGMENGVRVYDLIVYKNGCILLMGYANSEVPEKESGEEAEAFFRSVLYYGPDQKENVIPSALDSLEAEEKAEEESPAEKMETLYFGHFSVPVPAGWTLEQEEESFSCYPEDDAGDVLFGANLYFADPGFWSPAEEVPGMLQDLAEAFFHFDPDEEVERTDVTVNGMQALRLEGTENGIHTWRLLAVGGDDLIILVFCNQTVPREEGAAFADALFADVAYLPEGAPAGESK